MIMRLVSWCVLPREGKMKALRGLEEEEEVEENTSLAGGERAN